MFRKSSPILCAALLAVAALPSALFGATEAYHLNSANITSPTDSRAVIDATAVYNRGTFDFSQNTTSQPWDTSNTRYFTNGPAGLFPGVMKGAVGFRFDYAPSFGPRQPSAVFNNLGSGSISSLQTGNPDKVLVNATNIYNQGLLSVSANGLLQLTGTNMNYSKGGLEVRPIQPNGSTINPQQGTFTPDVAIYDNYWGLNLQPMDLKQTPLTSGSGTNISVASPQHSVNPGPQNITLSLVRPTSAYFDFTNGTITIFVTNAALVPVPTVIPTNIIRQAIFVGATDPSKLDTNFTVNFKLAPSSDPFNPSKTLMFQIANSATNVVDPTKPIQTSLYVKDTMSSEPGFLFLPANDTGPPPVGTFRPSNYTVSRDEPPEWANGSNPALGLTNGNFFYDQSFSNNLVVGVYSAYSFLANNVSSGPFEPTPGFTNLPGRVEIQADAVNLSQVRIRAEGAALINANNVLSTSNAVVDCQNVSYVLGAGTGNLSFQSLVQPQIKRVNGTVSLYTVVYTNLLLILSTNYNTNTPPNNFDIITNGCPVDFHLLMADRSKLFSTRTVVVHDLQLNSSNITFADTASIEDSLTINGDSFTLSGFLAFTNASPAGSLNDFGSINAPALKHFTNFGAILVTNVAAFGTDTLLPYETFYNRGTIGAYNIQVGSASFDTASNLTAAGSIAIIAGSAVFNKGTNAALGDFQIWANSLNLNQAQIYAGGFLGLNVTNALFDNGLASSNTCRMTNGLAMPIKPALGDLPGTTFDTSALMNQNAYHVWAGEDRGATQDGFVNNVTIGKLMLRANPNGGLLVFQPAGVKNAMYVNLLDLSALTNSAGQNIFTNQMRIDPGMAIYFSTSAGVPAATLNGKFDGRLVWVNSNAVAAQAALSDSPTQGLSLTWNAGAGGIYNIQTATNLAAPVWMPLMSYTNPALIGGTVTVVIDTNAPTGEPQRFYRINYSP